MAEVAAQEEAKVKQRIREGIWHDPRLDCVAGNGVMCELGVGDEWFGEADADAKLVTTYQTIGPDGKEKGGQESNANGEAKKKQASPEDIHAIDAVPIVILRGFDSKGGGARREEFLDVVSQWAAGLAQSQVCRFYSTYVG